jgi:hypothetical protein
LVDELMDPDLKKIDSGNSTEEERLRLYWGDVFDVIINFKASERFKKGS